jgi:hypothetical protein
MAAEDEERGAIPVRALLASKSLTPAVRARIAAADADGDGALSADEVLDVLRSEAALASERRALRRVAGVLAVGLVLAVAAVGGLTYGVVAASKDTASSGGALVDKASGAPLATGAATGRQDVSGLWRGADDAALAGLTALYATGADGVRRMWRVAGAEVAAGAWARVNTTEPGVSLYIDAEGVSFEGAPAEQAAGGAAAGAGRRRLLESFETDSSTGATCACGSSAACICCGNCGALYPAIAGCRGEPICVNGLCRPGALAASGMLCNIYACAENCATVYPATSCRAEGWCDPKTLACVPGAPDHSACAAMYQTPKCLGTDRTPTCAECLVDPTCVNGACRAGAYKSNTFGVWCTAYLCNTSCGAGWCNLETNLCEPGAPAR